MADLQHYTAFNCWGYLTNTSGAITKNPSVSGTSRRSLSKAAAAESAVYSIPVTIGKFVPQYGIKLENISIDYKNTTATLTSAITAVLLQLPQGTATGAATVLPVSIPVTLSGATTGTASANDQNFVVTVNTQAYDNLVGAVTSSDYELQITVPTASSSVFSIYDAVAYFNAVEAEI